MDTEALQVIRDAIKETVNGKIDRLANEVVNIKQSIEDHNEKHQKDMDRILPIIEAYNGVSIAGNGIKWIAGVGTAIGVLWILIKGLIIIK